jgi:GTPase SAR1 family protein
MKVGKNSIKLQVWDTAGQERFKSMTKSFFQKAKAVIIAFDLTNQESYDDVSFWMRQIEINCPPTITKVLVGK